MSSLMPPVIMNEYANDLFKNAVSDEDMDMRKDQKKLYNFRLKSTTDQITKTVQRFDELLNGMNCCTSRDKSELSTALSEALANAIIHGNKTESKKTVDL